jgi:hypothetical protein
MSEQKDTWDKISIVSGSLLVPLLIGAVTILGNAYINRMEQLERLEERDIQTMLDFQEIYENERSFRLARYLIPQVKSLTARRALREYVIWDLLERNIRPTEDFQFDPELGDWHMLGEVIKSWCVEQVDFQYYRDVRDYSLNDRWKDRATELAKLFEFVERGYLRDHPRCH